MIRNALCGLAAMVVFLAGCGATQQDATPKDRWGATAEGFNAVRKVVLDLHANKIIDDETLVAVDRGEKVGRGALDVAYTQVGGGGDAFEMWLSIAKGSLTELARTYEVGAQ